MKIPIEYHRAWIQIYRKTLRSCGASAAQVWSHAHECATIFTFCCSARRVTIFADAWVRILLPLFVVCDAQSAMGVASAAIGFMVTRFVVRGVVLVRGPGCEVCRWHRRLQWRPSDLAHAQLNKHSAHPWTYTVQCNHAMLTIRQTTCLETTKHPEEDVQSICPNPQI